MRFHVRTLMLITALAAVGLASPEPARALTLIFTCPLWLVAYAGRHRPGARPSE